MESTCYQFTNVQPSFMLMNWSKKMYCGFELCTSLLSMSEIPKYMCLSLESLIPLGDPNARCPFMERMTTRALSLGVETRRTEATWQTIRNASKLAKDHKKPLAGLHESWCIYQRGTSTYHHIHQVPQPTAVPPRKRPERPQFFKFKPLEKTRKSCQVSQKNVASKWEYGSQVWRQSCNRIVLQSLLGCVAFVWNFLWWAVLPGTERQTIQAPLAMIPSGVPFLKWYYTNMNPLQHTVVTLLPNPSQECFWKWPKPTLKKSTKKAKTKNKLHARSPV